MPVRVPCRPAQAATGAPPAPTSAPGGSAAGGRRRRPPPLALPTPAPLPTAGGDPRRETHAGRGRGGPAGGTKQPPGPRSPAAARAGSGRPLLQLSAALSPGCRAPAGSDRSIPPARGKARRGAAHARGRRRVGAARRPRVPARAAAGPASFLSVPAATALKRLAWQTSDGRAVLGRECEAEGTAHGPPLATGSGQGQKIATTVLLLRFPKLLTDRNCTAIQKCVKMVIF